MAESGSRCDARRSNGSGEPCCKQRGHAGPHAAVIVDQNDADNAVMDYWNDRPRWVGAS